MSQYSPLWNKIHAKVIRFAADTMLQNEKDELARIETMLKMLKPGDPERLRWEARAQELLAILEPYTVSQRSVQPAQADAQPLVGDVTPSGITGTISSVKSDTSRVAALLGL